MVRSSLRGSRAVLPVVWGVIFAGWCIYAIMQFRDWTTRAETVAFFAGAGGTGLMFFRWRRHGDRLARALCLAAFGTWMLAVLTWNVGGAKETGKPGSVGFDIAATALLIGFAGGIIVLIRLYSRSRRAGTDERRAPGSPV